MSLGPQITETHVPVELESKRSLLTTSFIKYKYSIYTRTLFSQGHTERCH